jgi:hypothetical protein
MIALAEKGVSQKAEGKQTDDTVRVTLRMPREVHEKLKYWADKKEYSVNDFVPMLVDYYAAIQYGDYELPSLEAQRVNQLIELVGVLHKDVQALQGLIIDGFNNLLKLTHGDNYLLEAQETGEF